MATTLGQIKDEVFSLMNDTSDNPTYGGTRVTNKINNIIKEICNGQVINLLTRESYKCLDLDFLRGKQAITFKEDLPISNAIVSGAVTISVDTTNLSTTGAVVIGGMVVEYTGKNATTLTGCTGINMGFDSGTYLRQVFKMNTDVDKTYRLFYVNADGGFNEMLEVPSDDDRFQRSKIRCYRILFDETSGSRFIDVRGFSDNDKFRLKYYKSVEDLADDTDESVLPDPYSLQIVAPLVAGEMLMETESETGERQNKLNIGYSKLLEMYNKYSEKEREYRKKITIQNFDYRSINPIPTAQYSNYTKYGFRIY